jgi:hypothetical protein
MMIKTDENRAMSPILDSLDFTVLLTSTEFLSLVTKRPATTKRQTPIQPTLQHMDTLLILQLTTTSFMVGLIWFIQIVHYPLMAQVVDLGFTNYVLEH